MEQMMVTALAHLDVSRPARGAAARSFYWF